jgi:5-methylcytosine-specific restriction endonuclease McrA
MVQRSLLIAALALLASAAPAQAKTCADYPNQAAAQVAHDTRDADGDGIFCEALPCPCLKPGDGGAQPPPAPSLPPAPSVLGISISLGHVSRRHGCRVHDGLPDRRCTPGARFSRVTRKQVCRSGYASSVRHVTAATKDAVYAAYGIGAHFDGWDGEVDHLVSLELGGSNARANLFPESATPRPGSHEKDRLENALHDEVCAGRISLRRAQKLIATDWVAAYHARFR